MTRTIVEEFDALIETARSTRRGDAGQLAFGRCFRSACGGFDRENSDQVGLARDNCSLVNEINRSGPLS